MPADRPRRGRLRVLAALLALTLLGACDTATSSAPPADQDAPAEPAPAFSTYVALGDSFTAAPLVPDTDLAEGCFRSSHNYPALLAEELDVRLRDVSCSGADTGDVTTAQTVAGGRGTVPPQLRAVRPRTDLVTVGIGGNDENVFATLVQGCTRGGQGRDGTPCAGLLEGRYGDPRAVIEETGDRVSGVLERIRRRSPEATVVLVGYLRLVSADEGCDLMPLSDEDRRTVAALEGELNDAMRAAAEAAGAEFLDMHPLSEGHEICSDEPWVNGIRTDQSRALAFHPFAEGQQAVADALAELLA